MPSPFPGMDPYLEDEHIWPLFQQRFIASLSQILIPAIIDRYRLHVGKRRYDLSGGGQEEDFLEVRERTSGRLITLLDLVSPANKTTTEGRQAYLDQRRQGKHAGANLIEIDLLLQGQPTLDYSRAGLPHWQHAVTVTRATQPERYEIYTSTLQKRLPRFRMPMAADDRDTVLDLQSAFARCYDLGAFAGMIDYTREPTVPLNDEERWWLGELLRQRGVRPPLAGSSFPHDQIALGAYYLWLQEGCVHGRDVQHWLQALEQLQQAAQSRRSVS